MTSEIRIRLYLIKANFTPTCLYVCTVTSHNVNNAFTVCFSACRSVILLQPVNVCSVYLTVYEMLLTLREQDGSDRSPPPSLHTSLFTSDTNWKDSLNVVPFSGSSACIEKSPFMSLAALPLQTTSVWSPSQINVRSYPHDSNKACGALKLSRPMGPDFVSLHSFPAQTSSARAAVSLWYHKQTVKIALSQRTLIWSCIK